MHPLSAPLRQGLDALGLEIGPDQHKQLLDYLDLMAKWTRVYNLTAVRQPQEMLTHHVLDSMSVILPLRRALAGRPEIRSPDAKRTNINAALPVSSQTSNAGCPIANAPYADVQQPERRPRTLLDVGSGAGLPGVVIAITCPHIQVTCVDAVAKKIAFIQQVAVALKLPNLQGLHTRIEKVTQTYDIVCSRAFASLSDFVQGSHAALAEGGMWMAMKGKYPEDELASLPDIAKVFHVEQLHVPGLEAQRCLVWMRG